MSILWHKNVVLHFTHFDWLLLQNIYIQRFHKVRKTEHITLFFEGGVVFLNLLFQPGKKKPWNIHCRRAELYLFVCLLNHKETADVFAYSFLSDRPTFHWSLPLCSSIPRYEDRQLRRLSRGPTYLSAEARAGDTAAPLMRRRAVWMNQRVHCSAGTAGILSRERASRLHPAS